MAAIVPARLACAADGTPVSEAYGDVYHSADGGLEQARHVFLAGNGLPQRWQGRERFVVLETGFGLGLNFLATWQAWRDDPKRSARLHFVSVEKHPFVAADLAELHRRWPELEPLAAELRRAWPPLAPGVHRLAFDGGAVVLTLLFGDATTALEGLVARADAMYLDGFAPARNPELWSPALLKTLTGLAAPGATLATWTVAGEVRESLAAAGWQLEKRPGFGRKRDMLCGRREPGAAPASPERRAIVVGAGIAGSTCAASLAARGWQVEVFERRPVPASEASGNAAGILLPLLAKDDNLASRLSRACYFQALRVLAQLTGGGSALRWSPAGVVQIARNPEHETIQQAIAARLEMPDDFVRFLDREALGRLVGRDVALGGWHFPRAGWISPPTLCRALLDSGEARVHTRFDCEIAAIERTASGWAVRDSTGIAGEAPHLILANAHAATALLPALELPLARVRGQVSYLPGGVLADLKMVVCRQGYVTPPAPVGPDGERVSCLGATFDSGDDDPNPRVDSHAENLRRLDGLFAGASHGLDPAQLRGKVGFRTATPDRLPLIGALPEANAAGAGDHLDDIERTPGLHGLLGYGARGMVWAPLAAELLAAQLEGEPLPLERDVVAAVDPARFMLRAARRMRR